MDETQDPSTAPLRVVASGVDGALHALIVAAAHRASVECGAPAPEAFARREIETQRADVAVVGEAPSGSARDAMLLAERLTQVRVPVPVILLVRAGVADADGWRLAGRGIEVLLASALDVDALARRFLLLAVARAREAQGRRAKALLQAHESLMRGLVHDLRTPLMAINLSAEVARVRSPEDAVQQAMRRIRSSTQNMGLALDHLSNLARLDPRVPRGLREPADAGELGRAAVEATRRAHPDVGVDLELQGDLRVHADVAALERALTHVLSTAAEYASGQRVHVRIDGSSGDRVWFEVRSPSAIPPQAQEQLAARGSGDRSGLGLHAIEAIVQAHAGSIVGRSKAPEGTVFELLLPRDVPG